MFLASHRKSRWEILPRYRIARSMVPIEPACIHSICSCSGLAGKHDGGRHGRGRVYGAPPSRYPFRNLLSEVRAVSNLIFSIISFSFFSLHQQPSPARHQQPSSARHQQPFFLFFQSCHFCSVLSDSIVRPASSQVASVFYKAPFQGKGDKLVRNTHFLICPFVPSFDFQLQTERFQLRLVERVWQVVWQVLRVLRCASLTESASWFSRFGE